MALAEQRHQGQLDHVALADDDLFHVRDQLAGELRDGRGHFVGEYSEGGNRQEARGKRDNSGCLYSLPEAEIR